jgi:hypothetical protein
LILQPAVRLESNPGFTNLLDANAGARNLLEANVNRIQREGALRVVRRRIHARIIDWKNLDQVQPRTFAPVPKQYQIAKLTHPTASLRA